MLAKRLIKSNDSGGCTNTVDSYNPFPDGGGVALYQLNGNADDVSGNYDGTASNVTYGAGQFGQAGVFNGTNASIDIAATATTPLDFSNRNYSISAWVKTTITGSGVVVAKYGDTDSLRSFTFGFVSGTLRIYERINGGGTSTSANTSVNDGNWHHVVVTKSPTQTIIYIDGAADVTNNNTTTANNGGTYPIQIGRDNPSSPDWFNGSIDQVRIFSRALRPYEVEALYTEEYCTPTIVPSEHFNTVLYTGNQSTQSITGVGFQPDFIWIKERTSTSSHALFDSVRGVNKVLASNTTEAEDVDNPNLLTSFNSDGFSLGDNNRTNQGSIEMVAWNFKAGGAAVTNTDGTITSQLSANTEAGFSVVSYTGNGVSGATIGHGLGVEPSMIIVKNRDLSANWTVYHKGVDSIPENYRLVLNTTTAKEDETNNGWNDTAPTSSVFSVGNGSWVNNSNDSIIAYCFAEVEGFSNFGSYVGTGASGNTVVTGFEPAMVIAKMTSSTDNWRIYDNKRIDSVLYPNLSNQQDIANHITFLENGFTWNTNNSNSTGQEFIYMAFAADPTTIEPSLEDSFNTVTYTGNGGTNAITGVGFQPDLVWLKNRDQADNHRIHDSIRTAGYFIETNTTNAEQYSSNQVTSFDSNGFTLGSANTVNTNGEDYVSWNFKGAELPAINSNGSIPSVVSANPAAGFSIVSYTGNGNAATIGHGLNLEPSVVIVKNREDALGWMVYHSSVITATSTNKDYLELNTGDSIQTKGSATTFEGVDDNTIALGTTTQLNRDGDSYIAYCFHSVPSFSKIGSYIGDGTKTGPIITTGFRPAWVMIKWTDDPNNSSSWTIYSNKINTGDVADTRLVADTSGAEVTSLPTDTNVRIINFSDTGFEIAGNSGLINSLNGTYIYMAFANQF